MKRGIGDDRNYLGDFDGHPQRDPSNVPGANFGSGELLVVTYADGLTVSYNGLRNRKKDESNTQVPTDQIHLTKKTSYLK